MELVKDIYVVNEVRMDFIALRTRVGEVLSRDGLVWIFGFVSKGTEGEGATCTRLTARQIVSKLTEFVCLLSTRLLSDGSERRSTARQIVSKLTEFVCPSSTRPRTVLPPTLPCIHTYLHSHSYYSFSLPLFHHDDPPPPINW